MSSHYTNVGVIAFIITITIVTSSSGLYDLPLLLGSLKLEISMFLVRCSLEPREDYNLMNEYAYVFVSDGIFELTKVYPHTCMFNLGEKLMIQRGVYIRKPCFE